MGILEGEEKEKGTESIFKATTAENFLNVGMEDRSRVESPAVRRPQPRSQRRLGGRCTHPREDGEEGEGDGSPGRVRPLVKWVVLGLGDLPLVGQVAEAHKPEEGPEGWCVHQGQAEWSTCGGICGSCRSVTRKQTGKEFEVSAASIAYECVPAATPPPPLPPKFARNGLCLTPRDPMQGPYPGSLPRAGAGIHPVHTHSHSFLLAWGVLWILCAWWAKMTSRWSTRPPRRFRGAPSQLLLIRWDLVTCEVLGGPKEAGPGGPEPRSCRAS